MSESSLRLPLILVLLGAALWTFALAYWRPRRLQQSRRARLLATAAEGLVCAGAWSVFSILSEGMLTGTSIIDGVLAGAAWTVVAYYSRSRYQKNIPREPEGDGSQQAFGRCS